MSDVSEIQARRDARKAAAKEEHEAQLALDLEAVDALEAERGDTNVAVVSIPHTSGLPTLFAVRTPSPAETKRYRARVKPGKEGEPGDYEGAAAEIGAVCLAYPEREVYEQMVAARPGITTQAGLAALKLASGHAESEGKG
jgi:hypothetical protein